MTAPVLILDSRAKADTLLEQYDGDMEPILVLSAPVKAIFRPPTDRRQKGLNFDFSPLPAEAVFIEKLQQSIGRDIYLALDSDPRGECWCWLISEYMASFSQGATVPKRLHLAGLNREDLHESIKLVAPVETNKAIRFWIRSLFHSCLTRHLQRLLGTANGPGNLPLTYQTLIIMLLIFERENEVRTYSPTMKWQIKVRLDGGRGGFPARLEEVFGVTDDGYVRDVNQGKDVVASFRDLPFIVKTANRTGFTVAPPAPFSILEILREAHMLHGIGPRKVIDCLRKLYYGVEYDGTRIGLASTYVAWEGTARRRAVERIRAQVLVEYGENNLSTDGENLAGWEGLLPLKPEITANDLGETLTEEEKIIYDMVRSRAMASQMVGAQGNIVEVTLKAGEKCTFKTSMREVTSAGFLAAYHSTQDLDLMNLCPLSHLKEGSRAEVVQITPEQTTEFPPEFYSYESLFVDLSDFAVGPDVISIGIIQNMIDKGYLFLTADGSIRCKENIAKVVAILNRTFPAMTGMSLTAYMEQTIEEAVSLRKPLDIALRQFDQTLFMHGRVLIKYVPPTTMKKIKPSVSSGSSSAVLKAGPAAESADGRMAFKGEQTETPHPSRREALKGDRADKDNIKPEPPPHALTPESAAVETVEHIYAVPETVKVAETSPPPKVEVLETPLDIEYDGEVTHNLGGREMETVSMESIPPAIFDTPTEEIQEDTSQPPPPSPITEAEATGPTKPCPECHKNMVMRSDRYGKYWTCTGFPACRHAESFERGDEGVMPCPLCGGGIIQMKRTPAGKLYYLCPEKNCEFMAWSLPHAVPCQVCNSPFLVEKQDLSGRQYLCCPRAGCRYTQPMPGQEAFEPIENEASTTETSPPVKKKIVVRRVAGGTVPTTATATGKKRVVRVVRKK